jgi:four helix bundle protein
MDFALRILRLCASLPNSPEAWAIRKQLVRSGTSPGAQYREACRARSNAEFVSKIDSALQEFDETDYWLEMLIYSRIFDTPETHSLRVETDELIKMFVTMSRNAKSRGQA